MALAFLARNSLVKFPEELLGIPEEIFGLALGVDSADVLLDFLDKFVFLSCIPVSIRGLTPSPILDGFVLEVTTFLDDALSASLGRPLFLCLSFSMFRLILSICFFSVACWMTFWVPGETSVPVFVAVLDLLAPVDFIYATASSSSSTCAPAGARRPAATTSSYASVGSPSTSSWFYCSVTGRHLAVRMLFYPLILWICISVPKDCHIIAHIFFWYFLTKPL